MADDEKQENEDGETPEGEEEEPVKSKKPLALGGGVIGLVAVGYMLMLMAVPSDGPKELVPYEGPFFAPLGDGAMQYNLARPAKTFLSLEAGVEYMAYDEAYVTARAEDLVYQAHLKHAMLTLGTQKTKAELDSTSGKEIFQVEIEELVDGLIFPLHIGAGSAAGKPDDESGIAPGMSFDRSSYRAGLQNGLIHIDAIQKTIRLDDGDPMHYEGDESDLELTTAGGQILFVDLSRVNAEFVGEVSVGVQGQVKHVRWSTFLVQ